MDWKDVGTALGKTAPLLATILGGPAGAAVSAAGALVAAALNTEATPDAVTAALSADPAALAKVREVESAERVSLQQIALEQTKAELADAANARARDIAFLQAGKRNTRADLMVLMDVVGLVACLIVLCLYRDRIPSEAVALIGTIASFFGLSLRDAHNFEFSSSRSSQAKDATIQNLSK
jgi:hypothetical protein